MSGSNTCNKNRPRFKGIESFLRRIALNLGNTPSQTEVKIISCIPIDVTDLQHKIIVLEREIEENRRNRLYEGDRRPPENKDQRRTTVEHEDYRRTRVHEDDRRPREREDDRRSRDFELERMNTSSLSKAQCHQVVVNTALVAPQLTRSVRGLDHSVKTRLSSTTSKNKRSATSIAYPTNEKNFPNPALYPQPYTLQAITEDKRNGRKRNPFRKLKSRIDANAQNCNMQFVYYTETKGSPFQPTNDKKYHKMTTQKRRENVNRSYGDETKRKEAIGRSYLVDVIRKQYMRDKPIEELSMSTSFSTPMCRDVPEPVQPLYDTDACSCCFGKFQNIDKTEKIGLEHFENTLSSVAESRNLDHYNSFYDTNLDYVPVKEPSSKPHHSVEFPTKMKNRRQRDIKFCPANHAKSRFQPYSFNCYNVMTSRYNKAEKNKRKYKKSSNPPCKPSPPPRSELKPQSTGESSKSCVIECGGVYMKNSNGLYLPPPPKPKNIIVKDAECFKQVQQKNAECFTINTNDTECQTASSKSVQLEPQSLSDQDDHKTEDTLNQIKVILQTVLNEVKSNSMPKSVSEVKERKKDAFVQKSSSFSNIENCSALFHSYAYTPFGSRFGHSLSRQANSNLLPFTPHSFPQGRCLQNYPLFIQTTGRQCACCLRSMAGCSGGSNEKQACTATSAEVHSNRNKETDKLIKEIYKSLAINMDYLTKYNSENDSKSSSKNYDYDSYNTIQETKTDRTMVSMRSKGNQGSLVTTPTHTLTIGSTVVTNTESKISSRTGKKKSANVNHFNKLQDSMSSDVEQDKLEDTSAALSQDTITPESELLDSDQTVTSSRDSVEAHPQKTMRKSRPGLFSKVVKFWSRSKKNDVDDPRRDMKKMSASPLGTASYSDSDSDYETVYSQKSHKTYAHQLPVKHKRSKHDKRAPALKPRNKYSTYYLHKEYAQEKARRQLANSRYQHVPDMREIPDELQYSQPYPDWDPHDYEYSSDPRSFVGAYASNRQRQPGFHLQTKGYRNRSPNTRQPHVRFNPVNTHVRYSSPNSDIEELEGILKKQGGNRKLPWLKKRKLKKFLSEG